MRVANRSRPSRVERAECRRHAHQSDAAPLPRPVLRRAPPGHGARGGGPRRVISATGSPASLQGDGRPSNQLVRCAVPGAGSRGCGGRRSFAGPAAGHAAAGGAGRAGARAAGHARRDRHRRRPGRSDERAGVPEPDPQRQLQQGRAAVPRQHRSAARPALAPERAHPGRRRGQGVRPDSAMRSSGRRHGSTRSWRARARSAPRHGRG